MKTVTSLIKLLESMKTQYGELPVYIVPGGDENGMDNDIRVSVMLAAEEKDSKLFIMCPSIQDAMTIGHPGITNKVNN